MTARTRQKCSTSSYEIPPSAPCALGSAHIGPRRALLCCPHVHPLRRQPVDPWRALRNTLTVGQRLVAFCMFSGSRHGALGGGPRIPRLLLRTLCQCIWRQSRAKNLSATDLQLLMTAPKLVWPKVVRLCFAFARTKTAGCREPINIVCKIS